MWITTSKHSAAHSYPQPTIHKLTLEVFSKLLQHKNVMPKKNMANMLVKIVELNGGFEYVITCLV